MHKRAFIHFLLIAVLGFGPLAANMHFVSHFHDCEYDSAAAASECEHSDHQHADHPVNLALDNTPSFNEHPETGFKSSTIFGADCSIYHLYVGLSGCLSAAQSAFTPPVNAVVKSLTAFGRFTTEAEEQPSIRGPPIHS